MVVSFCDRDKIRFGQFFIMGDPSDRQPLLVHLDPCFPYGLFISEDEKVPDYEPKPETIGVLRSNGTHIVICKQNAFDQPGQRAGRYLATEWHPKLEVLEDGTPNPSYIGAVTDTTGHTYRNIAVIEVDESNFQWGTS